MTRPGGQLTWTPQWRRRFGYARGVVTQKRRRQCLTFPHPRGEKPRCWQGGVQHGQSSWSKSVWWTNPAATVAQTTPAVAGEVLRDLSPLIYQWCNEMKQCDLMPGCTFRWWRGGVNCDFIVCVCGMCTWHVTYVYMYVCTCMCVCVHLCMCVYIVCVCVCVCTCMCVCVCVHLHVPVRTLCGCGCVCRYVCVYAMYMYTCMYICACCVHSCVYVHVHIIIIINQIVIFVFI